MAYNNPTPVAIAVVRVRRRDGSLALLGIVRVKNPDDGHALPGGYVDEMETFEEAVVREFREEVGINTHPSQWRLMGSKMSAKNQVLVFCEFSGEISEERLDDFVPNDEAKAVLFLSKGCELCFPNHQLVAREYLETATAPYSLYTEA